jgi:hypothetical protein
MTYRERNRPLRAAAILSIAILSTVAPASDATGQTVSLTGTVREQGSSESIPGASLAIMGTSRGAKANRDGHYQLELEPGTLYHIRVTAIGYRPDTLAVTLSHDDARNILLTTSPLGGATITISADASRKEAHRIIQKVIDTKGAWQSAIQDYRLEVYSRLNVRSSKDTSTKVLAVLESVADGFWKRDKGYAERITARKQTANLPAETNRIALFNVENFYNDRIEFEDYSIVSPVAHDAFDRYDYDLIGEGELNGSRVYKISVEPLNDLYPAFRGTLWIDQTDYTIAYLDLSPNDAIKIGPVKDIQIEQTFSLVDNKYWMPSQLGFSCAIKLELPFVPTFHIEQNAVLQNYTINGGLDDSLFVKRRHSVAPSADSVDSLRWVAMRSIPLAADENSAYHSFDSLSKIPPGRPSFSPIGLLFQLIPGLDVYQYNRVEGSRFMLAQSISSFGSWPLSADGMVAYGIGDKRWKYSAEVTQGLTWNTRDGMGADVSLNGDVNFNSAKDRIIATSSIGAQIYDQYVERGLAYGGAINTLTTLLLHNDYPDYYRAKGFEVTYTQTPRSGFSSQFYFKAETDYSLSNVTNFSLLLKNDTFRINPAINEGRLHELGAKASDEFRLGFWEGTAGVQFAYANHIIGSDFSYFSGGIDLTLTGKTGGWGKTWIESSYNSLFHGALPNQQLFYFESRDAIIAPHDVFRTMSPLEFQGDKIWTVMFEQNFYDLPTRLLGITMPIDLHWYGFANAAGAIITNASQQSLASAVETLGSSPYIETGFGIGNILNVLRFDATWRLTHRIQNNFFVTGALVVSF